MMARILEFKKPELVDLPVADCPQCGEPVVYVTSEKDPDFALVPSALKVHCATLSTLCMVSTTGGAA